jgi:O-antigen/teichoic acid export membrane protein
MVLGAYAFCDKIIWAFRLLLISFSSAVYPRCTILYHEENNKWKSFKKNINLAFCIVFTCSAIIFLIAPSFIVTLFTGEENSLGIAYARTIAFVPLIIALNSLNLLELLIRNDYVSIFRISLVILAFSVLVSFLFLQLNNPLYFAYYPLVIESLCLILYIFYLRNNTDDRIKAII